MSDRVLVVRLSVRKVPGGIARFSWVEALDPDDPHVKAVLQADREEVMGEHARTEDLEKYLRHAAGVLRRHGWWEFWGVMACIAGGSLLGAGLGWCLERVLTTAWR